MFFSVFKNDIALEDLNKISFKMPQMRYCKIQNDAFKTVTGF